MEAEFSISIPFTNPGQRRAWVSSRPSRPDLCSPLAPPWPPAPSGAAAAPPPGAGWRAHGPVSAEPLALPAPGWPRWCCCCKLIAPSSAPASDLVEPGAQPWNAGPGARGCAAFFLCLSVPQTHLFLGPKGHWQQEPARVGFAKENGWENRNNPPTHNPFKT